VSLDTFCRPPLVECDVLRRDCTELYVAHVCRAPTRARRALRRMTHRTKPTLNMHVTTIG
jgi:hypothetical protein